MKRVRVFVLFFGLLCVCGKGWHYLKDGLKFERFYRDFPVGAEKAEVPEEKIRRALDQPYFYIGRGRQCYAFASKDGKYVLKFPRLDHFELPLWTRAFPFSKTYKEKRLSEITFRREFLLNSFRTAARELREETGLLYLHLSSTNFFGTKMQLVDRIRRSYFIDIDQTLFALQEKKELLMPAFLKALKTGDRTRAEEILNAFLELAVLKAKKGIFNKDASFLRNFGIEGKRAAQIDVGSFFRKKVEPQKDESLLAFRDATEHVDQWLGSVDLEMQKWFKTRCEEISSKL
ncbi:MAG: hypothetical protein A3E80_00320 [Chlamydiae bacterium RIFCSPHIGHO2_12_FULL_49_9]|nr:MAG: hypothetical protein A3E80_00320 [Chlamydiae bacterium RIFCSPHIGHO2_12_FULL_49_9]